MTKDKEKNSIQDIMYKLEKALYDLQQLPRLWYKQLFNFLIKKLGLYQINAENNIFITFISLNRPIINNFINKIKIMSIKKS